MSWGGIISLIIGGFGVPNMGATGGCCAADVMGDSYRRMQTATDWSALKPECLSNFTLLNSAISLCMRLCVCVCVGGVVNDLAWLEKAVSCQRVSTHLAFFS